MDYNPLGNAGRKSFTHHHVERKVCLIYIYAGSVDSIYKSARIVSDDVKFYYLVASVYVSRVIDKCVVLGSIFCMQLCVF